MPETTAYSCPQCGATLKLDPTTGKLTCDFCDGSYDVAQIEARLDEANSARQKAEPEVAAAKTERTHKERKSEKKKQQDAEYQPPSGIASRSIDEWEQMLAAGTAEHIDEVVGYVCTNCGAQVVADKLTVATSCQYCGSSVVVDQRLTGGLKPDCVIPFAIKAEDIPDLLTKWYGNLPLLPKNFFHNNQVGQVQGIYVPFWLYDGVVAGDAEYKSSKARVYTSGSYDVTETTYYKSVRQGSVDFHRVPVDASVRIDDDLMDSIEPYQYSKMKPFQAGYLTGFVAERFDQSPRQVFERSAKRMNSTANALFKDHLPGSSVKTLKADFTFSEAKASYAFLPVYLFNCKYLGKHYRYAVNGQTGKVVGEVPIGKRESLISFIKGMGPGVIGGAIVVAVLIFAWFCS